MTKTKGEAGHALSPPLQEHRRIRGKQKISSGLSRSDKN